MSRLVTFAFGTLAGSLATAGSYLPGQPGAALGLSGLAVGLVTIVALVLDPTP